MSCKGTGLHCPAQNFVYISKTTLKNSFLIRFVKKNPKTRIPTPLLTPKNQNSLIFPREIHIFHVETTQMSLYVGPTCIQHLNHFAQLLGYLGSKNAHFPTPHLHPPHATTLTFSRLYLENEVTSLSGTNLCMYVVLGVEYDKNIRFAIFHLITKLYVPKK